MLERDLVFEKSHVVVVALETVAEDKQMDPHEVGRCLWRHFIVGFKDLLLTKLLATFNHLYELFVLVDRIALFKNDGTDFIQLLLKT